MGDAATMSVVAAAVIDDGRLLVVSKWAAPDVFYLPGGKPDGDEPEPETLARELAEELGARPVEPLAYLVVNATAALEGVPMRLSVYRCGLSAPPRRAGEIAAMGWTDGVDDYIDRLAPAIRDVVVPTLQGDGLLKPRGSE